jgi:hypothetical protein
MITDLIKTEADMFCYVLPIHDLCFDARRYNIIVNETATKYIHGTSGRQARLLRFAKGTQLNIL